MICQRCKQRKATVHVKMTDSDSVENVEHHFCPNCADAFRATDPVFRAANRAMINLRILNVSPHWTTVKIMGGVSYSKDWEFLTSRLMQIEKDISVGKEFAIQHDDRWINWLKGNCESPE